MKIKEKSSRGVLRRLTAMALALALAFTGIGGGLGFIQAPEKAEAAGYNSYWVCEHKKALGVKKGQTILKKGGITYKVALGAKFVYDDSNFEKFTVKGLKDYLKKTNNMYIPIKAYLTKTQDEAVLLEDIKKKIKVKYNYPKFKVKKGKKYKVKTRKKGEKSWKVGFVSAKKLKSKAFKKKYDIKYVKTKTGTEKVTFRNDYDLERGKYKVKVIDVSAFKRFPGASGIPTRYKGGVYQATQDVIHNITYIEGTRRNTLDDGDGQIVNDEIVEMAFMRQAVLKGKITSAEKKYMTKQEIEAFPKALAYWNAFKKWKGDKPKFIYEVAQAITNSPYDYNQEYNLYDSVYSFFVKNSGTCSVKTYVFKLMCELADIPCMWVAWDEIRHAYNMVKLGGLWYYVDATWGVILQKPGSEHDLSTDFTIAVMNKLKNPDGEYSSDNMFVSDEAIKEVFDEFMASGKDIFESGYVSSGFYVRVLDDLYCVPGKKATQNYPGPYFYSAGLLLPDEKTVFDISKYL
jgi:hypothetical protein